MIRRPSLTYARSWKLSKSSEILLSSFGIDWNSSVNGGAYATLKEHRLQDLMRGESKKIMEERLKSLDPSIAARIIPDFPVGCRRLTPEVGYLKSFNDENTEMCWDEIERITETGIRTKKGEEEFDMIVCATGYNTSARPHWKHIGRNGRILTGDLEGFFSVQINDMPNYFMVGGPNFPVSHGTVYTALVFACQYALKWTRKIATEDIKFVLYYSLPCHQIEADNRVQISRCPKRVGGRLQRLVSGVPKAHCIFWRMFKLVQERKV